MNDNRFAGINWEHLLKRLTACAASWFLKEGCRHADDILPATGTSARDLAFATAQEFLRRGARWDENTGEEGLFCVIKTAMRHDFLDLVRKDRAYKRTDVLATFKKEEEPSTKNRSGIALADLPAPANNGFDSQEAADLAAQIYPLIGNDSELKEFVDAVLYCECINRREIAALLGISPQEVTNRQRRLQSRLALWRSSVRATSKSTGH